MHGDKAKILGIDYGDFTIGLAIFDVETDFIYPYKTIFREKANILRKSLREIIDVVKSEKITEVVVGYPLNINGSEGERVAKVKIFAKMLNDKITQYENPTESDTTSSDVAENVATNHHITIHFQDERLTTKEASEILSSRGIKKSEQKKLIDQVAAEIILTDYKASSHNK